MFELRKRVGLSYLILAYLSIIAFLLVCFLSISCLSLNLETLLTACLASFNLFCDWEFDFLDLVVVGYCGKILEDASLIFSAEWPPYELRLSLLFRIVVSSDLDSKAEPLDLSFLMFGSWPVEDCSCWSLRWLLLWLLLRSSVDVALRLRVVFGVET